MGVYKDKYIDKELTILLFIIINVDICICIENPAI